MYECIYIYIDDSVVYSVDIKKLYEEKNKILTKQSTVGFDIWLSYHCSM